MTNQKVIKTVANETHSRPRQKLETLLLHSDINILNNEVDEVEFIHHRLSSASVPSPPLYDTPSASPYVFSPWNQPISPFINSPWIHQSSNDTCSWSPGLIGSLAREEGHIYSLAVSNNLLYTGSDSKNVHVWKDLREFSGFKSSSGLVKAIVLCGNKIFTGHQDGKIRVWKIQSGNINNVYKRIGNLPTSKDYIKSSMNPKSYVKVRRRRNVPWIKHFDAVSCMSLDEQNGILYSGSWDKTVKVWRLSDFKCMESVDAHDDAVNSVAVAFDGMLFTGSADGTVKMWRREVAGKVMRHVLVQTLLKQESAVTAVAVAAARGVVYSGASDGLVSYWLREKKSLWYGGALRGHKMAVLCLAVAGSLVVSGSADRNICVWKRGEGVDHACMTVLAGHTGPVKCLTIEEESNIYEDEDEDEDDEQRWRLYSGSLDSSVKVWRLSEHAPEVGHSEEGSEV